MEEKELIRILERLKDVSIGVIGDFFLDKHLIIDPQRDEPSLETGLTAYQVVSKRISPGAAGTVTNNLTALQVGRVTALGIIGEDGEGYELMKGLVSRGVDTQYLIRTPERVTPTYTKPMVKEQGGEREINRLDIKNFSPTPPYLEQQIIERLYAMSEQVDAIIALDQVVEENCGVLTSKVREALADIGKKEGAPFIYVDSRANTFKFRNVMVKCNHYEAVKAMKAGFEGEPDVQMIADCGVELSRRTKKPVFITWGEQGQLVIRDSTVRHVPAIRVEGPIDICGAGDATTSGTVSALCCGASLEDAAFFGNIVASITIQQLGTTGTASPEQVFRRFKEFTGRDHC